MAKLGEHGGQCWVCLQACFLSLKEWVSWGLSPLRLFLVNSTRLLVLT